MLQAKIDGELGLAEGVIFDQHLAECVPCSSLLRRQQRVAASLFEALAPHRQGTDLTRRVMEHLPEMEPLRSSSDLGTWHSRPHHRRKARWTALVPAVAAAALISLAAAVYFSWTSNADSTVGIIGVVTQSAGSITCVASFADNRADASVKSFITCGNRYETGPSARMMLSLRGPTHVKVDENTRMRVFDDRGVSIETGRMQLDVAKDERPFVVNTPCGTITVLGTVFDIAVDSEKVLVTLKAGKVHIENDVMQAELVPGQQADFGLRTSQAVPRKVDAAGLMQWAEAIVADSEAYALFAQRVQPESAAELPGEEVFAISTTKDSVPRPITAFYLSWEPDGFASGHCSYDVRVCNESMVELFKARVDGSVFADKAQRTCQVDVPGDPIRNAGVLHLKIVPDFSTGDVMTTFSKVWALGI